MKVTKNQLKQLISEEIKNVLSEDRSRMAGGEFEYAMMDDYFRRRREKEQAQKAAQEKTPAPADSTDKADGDQDEAKSPADKIHDLAKDLEKKLTTYELQSKATAIINLVNKLKEET